jgi:hypothetical protein
MLSPRTGRLADTFLSNALGNRAGGRLSPSAFPSAASVRLAAWLCLRLSLSCRQIAPAVRESAPAFRAFRALLKVLCEQMAEGGHQRHRASPLEP